MKELPIGTQTFSDIIQTDMLYVDKTPWFYQMLKRPKGMYFLTRPRRFGKSLMLSTFETIFSLATFNYSLLTKPQALKKL